MGTKEYDITDDKWKAVHHQFSRISLGIISGGHDGFRIQMEALEELDIILRSIHAEAELKPNLHSSKATH